MENFILKSGNYIAGVDFGICDTDYVVGMIMKINDDNNYSNLKLIWVRGHENNNIYKQIPKLGIKMFDKENNLIDVFFDVKEANIKTKISTKNIRCCCYRNYCNNNKTNFSIKGYIFNIYSNTNMYINVCRYYCTIFSIRYKYF